MRKTHAIFIFTLVILLFKITLTTSADEVSVISNFRDVSIVGLYDNTTFYLGSDMKIEALVDGVKNESIQWDKRELDGASGILNIESTGSVSKITAISSGRVEIIAKFTDGLDYMRSIVVNIKQYPTDSLSQGLINKDITPISSRLIDEGTTLLQVEVNKSISSKENKLQALDNYLYKLAATGKLSTTYVNSDNNYDYFGVNSEGLSNYLLEIRVDKNAVANSEISNKLSNLGNIDGYSNNNGNASNSSTGSNEITKDQNVGNTNENITSSKEEKIDNTLDKSQITGGSDDIVILEGDGRINNPFRLRINPRLSPEGKVEVMKKYLSFLQGKGFSFLDIISEDSSSIFKFKLPNTSSSAEINDFYVELYIEKGDEKILIPLISSLKHNNDTNTEGSATDSIIDNKLEEQGTNKVLAITNDKSSKILFIITVITLVSGAIINSKNNKEKKKPVA